MLVRILGGIYISSIEPININLDLSKFGITHVLSVVNGPLPVEYLKSYRHLQVEICDDPSANLIRHLAECIAFMEEAIGPQKKHIGSILVHCAQGVSRLAAVVVAFLMLHYSLLRQVALYAVTRKCPLAMPNDGFLVQLDLFYDMKCIEDPMYPPYRAFLARTAMIPDSLRESIVTPTRSTVMEKQDYTFSLKCKTCRTILASSEKVQVHKVPDLSSRQAVFIKTALRSRRIISKEDASVLCSHYFLADPVPWMMQELEHQTIEGKFNCPKCRAKVGTYSWKGSRCSCGKWVVPAIHLQTAKVDKVV